MVWFFIRKVGVVIRCDVGEKGSRWGFKDIVIMELVDCYII